MGIGDWDKPLFLNLISDVFQMQKNAKQESYPKLMDQIKIVLERKKLCKKKWLKRKKREK